MLQPEDLPAEMPLHLRELVCAYANSHGSLRLMQGSFGACVGATNRFIKLLCEAGYEGDWEAAVWHFSPTEDSWEMWEGFEMPPHILEMFCEDSASMEAHEAHTAIYVDRRWFIDFTATQFGIDHQWPLIWEVKDAVHSAECTDGP